MPNGEDVVLSPDADAPTYQASPERHPFSAGVLAWSTALIRLEAELPQDHVSRVAAIKGRFAHCRTNTEDFLRNKHAETQQEEVD